MLMDLVPGDKAKNLKTPIWDVYKKILNEVSSLQMHILTCTCISTTMKFSLCLFSAFLLKQKNIGKKTY